MDPKAIIESSRKDDLTMATPIFDSMGPMPVLKADVQPFKLYGHKRRKRLARDTTRVLQNAGFAS